nr:hypothetical protein [Tanacetum cinerariifolium]
MVDHIAPPGHFSKLHHLLNNEFLKQYNITLAWQVAMGSQLRLWFEQEAKLLKKAVAQVAQRDQRIQARETYIKSLKALLEAEADMKETTKAKNVELVKELESLCVQFSDLQVSNHQLSQQVSTFQDRVTGEKRIKAAFEEFKKYKDDQGKNTPQCYTKLLDSLKNWNNQFFWVDDRVFPTVAGWRTSAPKDQ